MLFVCDFFKLGTIGQL